MLEGFIALPALPIVYLIASDARLRTRLGRLSIAGGVLAVITLSWMTVVDLIPKTSRPYVGSSSNDTASGGCSPRRWAARSPGSSRSPPSR
jgi:4-amino-4-deoxy-L-arabinose transferase-like glycosyltransferase